MKILIPLCFSLVVATAQEPRHAMAIKNCSVVQNCAQAAGLPLPISPGFEPQVQILITEFHGAPAGYDIWMSYVDSANAAHNVHLPMTPANTPFPNGITTTVVTVDIDSVTNVSVKVRAMVATGPSYE